MIESDKKWLAENAPNLRYHSFEEYAFVEKVGIKLRDKHTDADLETARQQALAELKKSKGIK